MTKMQRIGVVSALCALLTAFFVLLGVLLVPSASTEEGIMASARLTADESEAMLDVVKDGASDFQVVYAAADGTAQDSATADELIVLFRAMGATRVRSIPDSIAEEKEHEILLGETVRQLSKDLMADVKAADPEAVHVWIVAEKDGKVAVVANCDKAYVRAKAELLAFATEDGFAIPVGYYSFNYMTQAEIDAETEANMDKYIEELKEMNAEFEDSQFNTDYFVKKLTGVEGQFYKPLINEEGLYLKGEAYRAYSEKNMYEKPWLYPADNQHPRYLITYAQLDEIKALLELGASDPDSDYATLAREFWRLANTTEEEHLWGIFPEKVGSPSGEIYRYNGNILGMIDAKALAYLITGEEHYAYEAIICIKNAMLTLHYTTDIHMDVYHGPSHVMVTLAAVYDWCYDVLTEEDKWQMIWGTAQILGPQMESGYRYPPTGHNGVNGHGTGPQLLRDWMTMATVFYDEAPDWWEFIAGRYFEQYLPVSNAMFANGWVSQGTACYAPIKVHVAAWAAYLIYVACGENVLTPDAQQTMYFLMSHTTPRDYNPSDPNDGAWREYYFQTGDGGRSPGGTLAGYAECFVIAALYNDPVIYAYAKHVTDNHTRFDYGTIYTMTPAFQLCFTSMVDYNGEGHRDGVETIQYFADPAGQMTVREEWDNPDSIAVMMRLMNLTMANHEGKDHGTFQIYYKGILAATSGAYKKYGAPTHKFYLQATIGHNGLLVFNPNRASTLEGTDAYYYSGSQEYKKFESNYASWIENSRMVTTIGASYGYNPDGTAKYGYLAGDLTEAYPSNTVEYINRHMLTIFTNDDDFPALFVTFDQIHSDSLTYIKSWLLHTIKEPTVDVDNLSATVVNGDGKLLVQSLYGADSIMKVGGEGKAYWINGYFADYYDRGSWDEKTQSFTDENDKGSWVEGKNLLDEYTPNDNAENIWGRIELRADGEEKTDFLTLMAVTDTANDAELKVEKFESDSVYGLQALGRVIAFAKSYDKQFSEFSFETEGTGLHEYYIAGIEAGTWQVQVDGVSVAYTLSEEEGALLTFVAPAGKITLIPGKDVIGSNGGKIQYVTGGAILPDSIPYSYKTDEITPLPLEGIVRDSDTFLGWYLTPDFDPDSALTEIPTGMTGTVKIYAKFISTFLEEDYSVSKIVENESSASVNGINYSGHSKPGSSFTTKYDEYNDTNYLEWIEGEKDPLMTQTSTSKNFSMLSTDDKCITFTVGLGLNEGATPMKTELRFLGKHDVNGVSLGSKQATIHILNTRNDGNAYYIDDGVAKVLAPLSTSEITTFRIVCDFKNGEMRYYDGNDYYLATGKMKVPADLIGSDKAEDYLKCLTQYLWYWYGGSDTSITDAALRIYEIGVHEGDRVAMTRPEDAIYYATGGGKVPENAPISYSRKDGTSLPTAVTREGYEFDGWYLTPDFSGEPVTKVGLGESGPIIVYAKWTLCQNAIVYDLDGGSLRGKYPIVYDPENGTSITDVIPTRAGRVFAGWYTDPELSGEPVTEIGKGGTEPVTVYAKWIYPDGTIVYNLNGADFPKEMDVPYEFSTVTPTKLPTGLTKNYATFLGWYTDPDFSGEPVTEVPTDHKGAFIVYAKWNVSIGEDWSKTEVEKADGAGGAINGVNYGGKGDSYYKTVDENGERYLLWKPGTSDPTLIINNNKVAPATMASNSISYTLDIGKNGEDVIPNFEFRLIAANLADGSSTDKRFNIYFASMKNGIFYLGSGETALPLYDLNAEGRVTARIVIAFEDTTADGVENGTVTAYDENGVSIGMVTFGLNTASGANTIKEYKKCFKTYLFYTRQTDGNRTLDNAIRYYKLFVDEGNIHVKPTTDITYITNGGTLPEGAPTNYDSVNGTDISGVIPTRLGYIFRGWYTTPSLTDGTRVENIGKGETFAVMLYAKWDIDPTSIYYELDGGEITGGRVDFYDPENGTDVAGVTVEKHGFVFDGWYLDEKLTTPISVDGIVGLGASEPVTLYAKWKIRPDTIFYETNGGAINGEAPEFYDSANGTLLPTDVVREHYNFGGWYYDEALENPVGEGALFGIGGTKPITVYAKWTVPDGKLVFIANGGTLPEGMPDSYDPSVGILLPTDIVRDGYIFGGWYTDPEFMSERTDYVRYGSTAGYVFYAKWIKTLHNKTWDDETISHPAGKNNGYNGISMNSTDSTSGSFKTEDDANGGKYIEVTLGQGRIVLTASAVSGHQIKNFVTPEMAISFDYARVGANALLNNTLRLETSGSRYGSYNFMQIDGATGEARFYNESGKLSDKVIATVGDEPVTFRIVIDFYNETVTAYGESYEILDRVKLGSVPKISANYPAENLVQPTTWAEWQSVAYGYYFYNTFKLPTGVSNGVAAYDNLKVYDGNPYFTFAENIPVKNGIAFVTNGGTLENAPTHHDPVNGTDLTAVVPEKYGYVLEGWYTTESFEDGTRVERIEAGDIEFTTYYAKWVIDPTTLKFDTTGGEIYAELPPFYDKENGTDLTGLVPTKYGYVFDGWFDNKDFEGEALTSIGVGRTAPVTLYAKWSIRPDTLYSELNGGKLEAELPDFYDAVNGTDLTDFVPTKQGYTFVGWYDNAELNGEALTSVGAGMTAPVTIYAKWDIPANVLYYELNGGTLPEGAPSTYETETGVLLPTPTRDGYVFCGWYTDAEFTSERMDYIRYGDTSGYMLYANWAKVVMAVEDWLDKEGNPIHLTSSDKPNNVSILGIGYNASSGTEAKPVTYESLEDSTGDRYMKITSGGVSSFLNATGTGVTGSYHLKSFETTDMSIEFSYGKSVKTIAEDGTVTYYPLPTTTIRLQTPNNGLYGSCTFLTISQSGVATLTNSTKVIAALTDEDPEATFRLNLDFNAGTVTAYDENGAVLDSVALKFPTNMTATTNLPTTWAEWQRVATSYYFYGQLQGSFEYGATFDDVRIYDGKAFVPFEKTLPKFNDLALDVNGGTLPEGAPTEYDNENGTDLSAFVPEKDGFLFDGWYLDEELTQQIGDLTAIGKGCTEPITLYAKWVLPPYTIVYNPNGGTLPEGAPTEYDPVNGTTLPTPTLEGYVFGGWYTTESFEDGTRVEKIGIGETEAYELYARWLKVIVKTDLEKSDIDIAELSTTFEGVTFNANKKQRCTVKTIEDGDGKYVQMGVADYVKNEDGTYGSAIDSIVAITSNTHNLTQMTETTLSLQFDFVYTEGTRLANATIAIATSSSSHGSLSIGKLYGSTGEIKLTGSSVVIGDLMDDEGGAINGGRVTVRLAIDFAAETATAYGENGEVLDSVKLSVPKKSGVATASSLLEWQSVAKNYLLYSWIDNPKKADKDGILAYVGYDNFLLVDGDIYGGRTLEE